ncbi:hypothetical protein VYU27_002867 [Nannochloropsis oceanica]
MQRLSTTLLSLAALLILGTAAAAGDVCHLYSTTIESPCFTTVKNTSAYEVRKYGGDEMWTSAHIKARSFAVAQNKGFMTNFEYISGENSKEEKIPMTAPVIFRRSPDGDAGWLVSFFVPSKFATKDDVPLPNNEDMSIMSLEGATYAVRVFDGFATIWDFEKNEYELKKALLADGVAPMEDKNNGVIYAGYDSPFVYVNRHNEVWVRVA